ncbi:MAG: HAMP domain-containing histidine kinase, partial [Proteobacteria bacterium]|nr:HAMP domain-containing histidine kinase [Pseudomonadota bacterium]
TRAFATRTADGGLVIVGADPEALEELDHRMIPLFAVAFGLIAAIAVSGAFLLSRALGRRLDSITRTAHAISAGDLTRRVALSGNGDEFDRLALTLNLMLDRIAALLDNLRQVSSDLAHDMRTPIARLRQKLDLALAGDHPKDELRVAMQHAVEQTEDILELFAAILGISEVEAGTAVTKQTVDLTALISDLADAYQNAAEEDGGRAFDRDIAADITIEGNRGLIAQATTNLLDNALRHTPAGTGLAIALSATAHAATITVADHGEGIPEEQRDNVFARFTRLERSRTTPGHGLGLSLVAAIAKVHGGSVRLDDNHPGVKAMIVLPRRPR